MESEWDEGPFIFRRGMCTSVCATSSQPLLIGLVVGGSCSKCKPKVLFSSAHFARLVGNISELRKVAPGNVRTTVLSCVASFCFVAFLVGVLRAKDANKSRSNMRKVLHGGASKDDGEEGSIK